MMDNCTFVIVWSRSRPDSRLVCSRHWHTWHWHWRGVRGQFAPL